MTQKSCQYPRPTPVLGRCPRRCIVFIENNRPHTFKISSAMSRVTARISICMQPLKSFFAVTHLAQSHRRTAGDFVFNVDLFARPLRVNSTQSDRILTTVGMKTRIDCIAYFGKRRRTGIDMKAASVHRYHRPPPVLVSNQAVRPAHNGSQCPHSTSPPCGRAPVSTIWAPASPVGAKICAANIR